MHSRLKQQHKKFSQGKRAKRWSRSVESFIRFRSLSAFREWFGRFRSNILCSLNISSSLKIFKRSNHLFHVINDNLSLVRLKCKMCTFHYAFTKIFLGIFFSYFNDSMSMLRYKIFISYMIYYISIIFSLHIMRKGTLKKVNTLKFSFLSRRLFHLSGQFFRLSFAQSGQFNVQAFSPLANQLKSRFGKYLLVNWQKFKSID